MLPPEPAAAPSPGIEAPKPAFPAPAAVATQSGPNGIRFDFNEGCRVTLPPGGWRVRLRDIDTDNVLFETELEAGAVMSTKKYYVRFCIEIWRRDGAPSDPPPFVHRYDAAAQRVLIQFPVGTIGDVVGWLPDAVKFQPSVAAGSRVRCRTN